MEESVKAGIVNGIFEAHSVYGAKLLGKVGRIWSKGEKNDVHIDEQGNVSLVRFKDQSNPNKVDFEMMLDPTDGIYKESAEVGVNRAGKVAPSDASRELTAENPKRIEVAQSDAVQKAAVDTRAQKVVENLKGQDAVSIEQIQEQTRFNKTNVEDAVMLLYAAKQVEILPDNSVRFIGGENVKTEKSLFERASEINKPTEPIKLERSPIENEIKTEEVSSSDSLRN